MNPELTYTLPQYQTESGAADILMHTMERYFTNVDTMELTDTIAESLMRNVMRNAKILMTEPENYEARANIMWASSLAHNDLTGCGSIGDYASHLIEHELGGMFDVTHGAGLAAIWGSWARYVYKHKPARFAQFAVNVLGVYNHPEDPERTALEGIEAMEDFYRSIAMPISIKELLNGKEVTDAEIDEMADKATQGNTRTIGNFVALNKEDLIKIYNMAR